MSAAKNNPQSPALPDWGDCDHFCINGYAGTDASPCGWRGRVQDIKPDSTNPRLVCPGCGGATLLRIPIRPTDSPEA